MSSTEPPTPQALVGRSNDARNLSYGDMESILNAAFAKVVWNDDPPLRDVQRGRPS